MQQSGRANRLPQRGETTLRSEFDAALSLWSPPCAALFIRCITRRLTVVVGVSSANLLSGSNVQRSIYWRALDWKTYSTNSISRYALNEGVGNPRNDADTNSLTASRAQPESVLKRKAASKLIPKAVASGPHVPFTPSRAQWGWSRPHQKFFGLRLPHLSCPPGSLSTGPNPAQSTIDNIFYQ